MIYLCVMWNLRYPSYISDIYLILLFWDLLFILGGQIAFYIPNDLNSGDYCVAGKNKLLEMNSPGVIEG